MTPLAASSDPAFPSTQWSVVIRACADPSSTPESHRALEMLCGRYWYPLYAFVRRQGRNHHEAEDYTQAFLAHLLATDALQHACPERGRFRTFLLSSLRHHIIAAWRHDHAEKRGGRAEHVPIDFSTAEDRFSHEPADPALTPEQAYDRAWARGLIAQATVALSGEFEKSGRGHIFSVVAPLLVANSGQDGLAHHAETAGLSTNSFTVILHRARRRMGEILRDLVAETVLDPKEVDTELRHLIQAVV